MSRRTSALLLGVGLLALASGCRNTCSAPRSWFTSNTHSAAPCRLVGGGQLMEGCYDPITGQPVPCPPATTVIPGGPYPNGTLPRADELPFPEPADMIPPTGVPSAPPSPAPPPFGGASLKSKDEPAIKTRTKQ